jgi:hypothetical protein
MRAVEFTIDLTSKPTVNIPQEVAAQLPATGQARVIILTLEDDDTEWLKGASEQFMRDDAPEDAIYDTYS